MSNYVVWATIIDDKSNNEIYRKSFEDKVQAEIFFDEVVNEIETEHLKGLDVVNEITLPTFKKEKAYVELDIEPNFEGRSQMLKYKYFYA